MGYRPARLSGRHSYYIIVCRDAQMASLYTTFNSDIQIDYTLSAIARTCRKRIAWPMPAASCSYLRTSRPDQTPAQE